MIGICLLNMGGPDSLDAIRPFLFNLFSDRYIIRLGPSFLQRPIAWLIAKKRAPKSAQNYELIGGKTPLTEITIEQAKLLEGRLNEELGPKYGEEFKCVVGMRYWHPRTPDVLKELKDTGVKKVLGLSLYPHYSRATSGSSIEEFKSCCDSLGLSWDVIDRFPTHPAYISALCEVLDEGQKKIGNKDFHLVYSAHSLPKKFIDEGDPYLEDINATIRALESQTGIKGTLSFQSRSGPVKWLEPQTDIHLLELVKSGKKRLLCLPISFVSDHIETLYEIDILFKSIVKEAGGELFKTPGLNTRPSFINALYELVVEKLGENKWLR
ncbi:ferrochelatase [Dissulfuribacter thermophilus]|nr:ferrochelatase [Dissulfuribacter thermophilus]